MKTKFKDFLNENNNYDLIEPKLKILRKYIKILDKEEKSKDYNDDDYNSEELPIRFFIIIHNWLIIEQLYYGSVALANKQLNKYLNLKDTEDIDEIKNIFNELYNPHHKVRFAVETFDSIEPIRLFLNKNRDILYNKTLRKKNGKYI